MFYEEKLLIFSNDNEPICEESVSCKRTTRRSWLPSKGSNTTLVQKLESLGELLCLVVGAFGEVSENLESTIKALAEAREAGLPVSDTKAGWILGQYRILLSCQASCLLARMGHLGEGVKECAATRRVAKTEEMRMRKGTGEGVHIPPPPT